MYLVKITLRVFQEKHVFAFRYCKQLLHAFRAVAVFAHIRIADKGLQSAAFRRGLGRLTQRIFRKVHKKRRAVVIAYLACAYVACESVNVHVGVFARA